MWRDAGSGVGRESGRGGGPHCGSRGREAGREGGCSPLPPKNITVSLTGDGSMSASPFSPLV